MMMIYQTQADYSYVVDLYILAVHVPGMHNLLWVLGVAGGTPVPSLSTVGTLHSRQFHAQRSCGPERDCRLDRDFHPRLLVLRHCSQHRRAY